MNFFDRPLKKHCVKVNITNEHWDHLTSWSRRNRVFGAAATFLNGWMKVIHERNPILREVERFIDVAWPNLPDTERNESQPCTDQTRLLVFQYLAEWSGLEKPVLLHTEDIRDLPLHKEELLIITNMMLRLPPRTKYDCFTEYKHEPIDVAAVTKLILYGNQGNARRDSIPDSTKVSGGPSDDVPKDARKDLQIPLIPKQTCPLASLYSSHTGGWSKRDIFIILRYRANAPLPGTGRMVLRAMSKPLPVAQYAGQQNPTCILERQAELHLKLKQAQQDGTIAISLGDDRNLYDSEELSKNWIKDPVPTEGIPTILIEQVARDVGSRLREPPLNIDGLCFSPDSDSDSDSTSASELDAVLETGSKAEAGDERKPKHQGQKTKKKRGIKGKGTGYDDRKDNPFAAKGKGKERRQNV